MEKTCKYKVVECCKITPWASPSPTITSLPLTFFDIPWIGPHFVKRLFFYEFPHTTQHFQKSLLPNLKHSLSLTLLHFFPLSGNLLCPSSPPHKPFIRCTPHDSVPLTVIESSSDFTHLVSNHQRDLEEFDHLVPTLLSPITCDDTNNNNTLVFPLLALKITVFPNHGLCIGASYRHAVDGRCFTHFMKSWACVCRHQATAGDLACLENSLPFYDRKVIKDPNGVEAILLTQYFNRRSTWNEYCPRTQTQAHTVKVTFVLSQIDTERLKKWILNQCDDIKNVSRFVVTCALIWVCLIKSGHGKGLLGNKEEEEECFFFPADCRNRLDYQLPQTYFGNCIAPCCVAVKRKELMGENGMVAAVKVIEKAISEIKSENIENAEMWMCGLLKSMVGEPTRIYGSPNLKVYEIDFGFGRPRKIEIITGLKCISLAESGNAQGGIEVGLVLKKAELQDFELVLQQALATLN